MKISVIIPVLNEEKYINFCIRSLIKKLGKSLFEIIVVDSSPNQSTLKKIDKYPINIVKITSPRGRGLQLNTGAKIARGDTLLFLHVDSIIPNNSLNLIQKYLKDNIIISFSLGFYDKKAFFRMIEFFGKIRCFITSIPYGDQCYVMKKETYLKIEKFPEEELEDVKFIKKAKKMGIKIKILKEKIKTSPRKYYKNGFLKTVIKHRLKILSYIIKH